MRIILLTHGGSELLIEQLVRLENIDIVGVFIEDVIAPQRSFFEKFKRSLKYDGYFTTFNKMILRYLPVKTSSEKELELISDLRQQTEDIAARHSIPVIRVHNYHSEESIELLQQSNADIAVIYGTNIVKEIVFSIPKLGSINLHQGLAPNYRGGPSIFWELFNDEKEVGLTVHFVASKVDTGDIILQETVPLSYDFSFDTNFELFLDKFRLNLKSACASLVSKAVKMIETGDFPRIKQNINLGKRYRLPLKSEKNELKRRLKARKKKLV